MGNLIFKVNKKIYQFLSYKFYELLMLKYHKKINYISRFKRLEDSQSSILNKKNNNNYLPCEKIVISTNSKIIDVYALYSKKEVINNMSNIAVSGIDVYIEENKNLKWVRTIYPNNIFKMYAYSKINFESETERKIIIYLPNYAQVKKLYLLPEKGKTINKIETEKETAVLYGSSISQGCAASRSSLSFGNLLSRNLNLKVMNFGFSESAKAEEEIIEYISKIKTRIFIIEYDHNSELDEFASRHLNLYKMIRKNNKDAFIIFMSRLSGGLSINFEEEKRRLAIINSTMNYAENNGDINVFFLNGSKIIKQDKDLYFVDDKHPNDLGMKLICDEIEKIIKEKKILDDI